MKKETSIKSHSREGSLEIRSIKNIHLKKHKYHTWEVTHYAGDLNQVFNAWGWYWFQTIWPMFVTTIKTTIESAQLHEAYMKTHRFNGTA